MRKAYVGGNWKMNLDRQKAVALARALTQRVGEEQGVEVAVCPPLPYLIPVAEVLSEGAGAIKLGAQNFYHQPEGAYTGEVSLNMLRDVGASVVLAGHSERRHVLGEADTLINEKVLAALEADLEVILCVGETLAQREAGKTDAVNSAQLTYGLAGVKAAQTAKLTIAYEPVWAIGTGRTATPQDAQNAHQAIRETLRRTFDPPVADAVRIQYGGSVKPGNAEDLFAQTEVDGFLVGGASLKAEDFSAIVQAAK